MAFTEKVFFQETIDSSNDTIYTGVSTDIIKIIWIANVHTIDVTVDLWFVPNGGSAADSNKLIPSTTIPIGEFIQIQTYLPMATGSTIVAKCSVADKASICLAGASVT